MKKGFEFSVLIPVGMRADASEVQECLESIYNQTLLPSEIVLVLDGPASNKMKECLKSFKNKSARVKVPLIIKSLRSSLGVAGALNKGLGCCKYSWVARMDADDICYPERFATQVSYLKSHPKVRILGAWLSEFEGNVENVVAVHKLPEDNENIKGYIKSRCPFRHNTIVYDKNDIIQLGGYPMKPNVEDYLLWIKCVHAGLVCANIQQELVYFRGGEQLYKRRRGLKYIKDDLTLQRTLYKYNMINFIEFCKNMLIRSTVRLMPASVLKFIYKRFVRGR